MFGGRLGLPELALIVLIVLIVFGAGKLPEIGGAIGKGIKAFRSSQKEEKPEAETKSEDKPKS